MASFLSSIGRISVHFDNINLKFSTHVHFDLRFHSMLSKRENSKIGFYEVITNELYIEVVHATVLPVRANKKKIVNKMTG